MSILEDKTGNLWVGTRMGISKLNTKSNHIFYNTDSTGNGQPPSIFKNLTFEDGFFGIGCNSNSICEDQNGSIWIGANDRLTVYRPESTVTDTIPPDIQLAGIELFNEKIPWADVEKKQDTSIVLSNGVNIGHMKFDGLSRWYGVPEHLSLASDDNFLTFHFIGITTKSTQNVKYKYKLDGLDENWSIITSETSASFGNISPGKYIFRVKAMNSEGYWSSELMYNFAIRPPWWKTLWAYFFYSLGLILGIILVDRIQTQRVIAKEHERIRDRELEHAREIEKAYQQLHLQHEIVENQKIELEVQKKLSDELLLNILPAEVADELKTKGFADTKVIDEVTVIFTDFIGFTLLSEKLSPTELVTEIHECFSAFDHIMQLHGIEKIKTIGDSYMAAGGLPTPNQTHSTDAVKAALAVQQFMHEHNGRKKEANEPFIEIRIGLHTGPVIAGIVGVRKFAYDIWGDTVNTASHIESSGDAGKINISGATYNLIKNSFNCTYRGKIEAKNKGMIDMYFVNSAM